jgi:D-arabinose 1-dehydrogenase-like Zn-dependent alcohol dehydrogenase
MVVHEAFGIKIPQSYPLECAGPVMCAGVTLFDPLRRYGTTTGTRVCIIGVGGLGVMGIKLAKAMGATVTAVSRSAGKAAFVKSCGAEGFISSSDAAQMKAGERKFDLVLNTIPSDHDYTVYSALLAPGGKHVLLGLHAGLVASMVVDALVCGASKVKGSGIGSIEATQAVIDLCAKADIKPEVKVISAWEVNGVYETLDASNDASLRYVLDIGTLNEGTEAKCTASPPRLSGKPTSLTGSGIVGAILGMLFCCRWR